MFALGSIGRLSAPPYSSSPMPSLDALWRRFMRVSQSRHRSDNRAGADSVADERSAPTDLANQPGGASDAYESFIREHQRAIVNYLWRMTGDEQSAYDLTQEVFVRAWRHFAKLRDYTSPRAWLFRVATNLAISALRSKRTLSSVDLLPVEQQPASSDPAWRVVERDLVRVALDTLPPQRRAALTLREIYGLSCAEVARALGISEAAARMTLSRAREQFRAAYLREGGDQHDA